MAQDRSTIHTHRNHILPVNPKDAVFLYIRQKNSISSLLKNPDTESYQDNLTQPFPPSRDNLIEPTII